MLYSIIKEALIIKKYNTGYDALDVCLCIIDYCNEKKYNVSNLRLQKILYFVQVIFLRDLKKCCFKNPIRAWDFGPVVPEVYQAFKQYGAGNIPKITSCVVMNNDNIWDSYIKEYNPDIISEEDQKTIQEVVEMCADKSTTDLVTITHNQKPWKQAYKNANNEITIKSLKDYFSATE